jgi:hypothetical protein
LAAHGSSLLLMLGTPQKLTAAVAAVSSTIAPSSTRAVAEWTHRRCTSTMAA